MSTIHARVRTCLRAMGPAWAPDLREMWVDCSFRHGPESPASLGCLAQIVSVAWPAGVNIEVLASAGCARVTFMGADVPDVVERTALAEALTVALEVAVARRTAMPEPARANAVWPSIELLLVTSIGLARAALDFGLVTRATAHADGVTPESDTTHTFMLQLLVLVLAPLEGLDPERCLGLVLVHDLPELYAKDTDTARGLTDEQRREKEAREAEAVARLRGELPQALVALLDEYEAQQTRESQFVRLVDKLTPSLTHAANGCATLRARGWTIADVQLAHATKYSQLERACPWATTTLDLILAAYANAERIMVEQSR